MQGKPVSASATIMAARMFPQDANPSGNVHGGVILKYIDLAAATAAMRHARHPVVTKSIERMEFRAPAHVGELVSFKASVNYAGTTSMEVGVRVEAENLQTGEVRHTASAYLTLVSFADGKAQPVAPLICETDAECRRFLEAEARRVTRRAEREREHLSQTGTGQDKDMDSQKKELF